MNVLDRQLLKKILVAVKDLRNIQFVEQQKRYELKDVIVTSSNLSTVLAYGTCPMTEIWRLKSLVYYHNGVGTSYLAFQQKGTGFYPFYDSWTSTAVGFHNQDIINEVLYGHKTRLSGTLPANYEWHLRFERIFLYE